MMPRTLTRLHYFASTRLGFLLLVAGMAIGCGKSEPPPANDVPVIKVKPEQLSDPSQIANALFVEASLLFAQYEAAEGDIEKQYLLADKAMQNLEKIVTTYPQTEMAVKLIQGQAIINGKAFSLAEEKPYFNILTRPPSALLLSIAEKQDDIRKSFQLGLIASAMAQAGDKAGAKVVLTKALAIAEKREDSHGLGSIASVMAETGDTDGAKGVLAKALTIAEKGEDRNKAYSLRGIASAMAKMGDTVGALAIAGKLNHAVDLGLIASAMAEAGDKAGAKVVLAKALAIAGKMEDGMGKTFALSPIASAMAQAGDTAGAKMVFANALATAEKLGDNDKAPALSVVASEMAKAGDYSAALTTAEKLGGFQKVYSLEKIASAMAKTGNKVVAKMLFADALAIVEELKVKGDATANLLRSLAISMARAGDTVGALAIAEKLEGEDRAALRFIVAFSLCTTEIEGTKDAIGEGHRKMKPSFEPEDKPLVRKLLALLPK